MPGPAAWSSTASYTTTRHGLPTASGTISGVGKRIHRTASAGSET